jgi:hypothetical protein
MSRRRMNSAPSIRRSLSPRPAGAVRRCPPALEGLAEGIETVRQLAFRRRKGCDGGQGFRCSPSLAAEGAAYSFDQPWIMS